MITYKEDNNIIIDFEGATMLICGDIDLKSIFKEDVLCKNGIFDYSGERRECYYCKENKQCLHCDGRGFNILRKVKV